MDTQGSKRKIFDDSGKQKKTQPKPKVRRSVLLDEDDFSDNDRQIIETSTDASNSKKMYAPIILPEMSIDDDNKLGGSSDYESNRLSENVDFDIESDLPKMSKKSKKHSKYSKISRSILFDDSEAEEDDDLHDDTDSGDEEPLDGISIGSQDSMNSFIVHDDEELSEYEPSESEDDDEDYVGTSSSSSSSSLQLTDDKISDKISALKNKIDKLSDLISKKTLKMEFLLELQKNQLVNKDGQPDSPTTPESNVDDDYRCIGCNSRYNGNSQFCSRSCFNKNC